MNFEKLLKEAIRREQELSLEMLSNKPGPIDLVRLFDMSGRMSSNRLDPETARKNLENAGFHLSFVGNSFSLSLQK